jgi:hypothetical protein
VPAPDLARAGQVLLAVVVLLLLAGNASAYVGPGAGLDLVGYSFGLLMWMTTAFSAVLLWPVYALLRRLRGGKGRTAPAVGNVSEGAHAGSQANP